MFSLLSHEPFSLYLDFFSLPITFTSPWRGGSVKLLHSLHIKWSRFYFHINALSPSSFLSAGSLEDWKQSIHPIRLFLSLDVIFVSLTCFASLLVWALFLPASLPVSLCVVLPVSLVQQMRISQIQWEVTSMLTEPQASVGVMARVGWPVEVKWDCHCGPEGEKAHRATQPETNTWGCWQI